MNFSADKLATFCQTHTRVMEVCLRDVRGSSPREEGANMLVAAKGVLGTIGGGQLEYMAIDLARVALSSGERHFHKDVPLGPEIGQCCGGRVRLQFREVTEARLHQLGAELERSASARPEVLIFGAGHVGRALANALAALPFSTCIIDERATELALVDAEVKKVHHLLPERVVREASAGAFFVVLTHDHALDFQIVHEALSRGDAAYVGMIGSKSKRAVLKNWLDDQGADLHLIDELVCPIGGREVRSKQPEVIAAMVAAELLIEAEKFERLGQTRKGQAEMNRGQLDAVGN